MRCEVYDCISNDDGYCGVSDRVSIDKDGSCSELYIISSQIKGSDDDEC